MTYDTQISFPAETLHRILAIDPSPKGFGYVVIESPSRLVDWGLKEARDEKNSRCLRQIEGLARLYAPTLIVIENIRARDSRRSARVRELLAAILPLARNMKITVRALSKSELRHHFEAQGAATKDEIAQNIAERFPELALRLPPARKPWNSPDPRMAIFVAMALALTAMESGSERTR